jgi:tRNA threonylcarbamoyladenosine biosynthesis protein TsaB
VEPETRTVQAPLLLGLETATFCGSVALLAGDRLVASRTLNSPATHSARLLRTIEDLLGETTTRLENLAALAVSIGPGSFTGVRIGLSVAKGLAFALDIAIVGVSTLEALAVRAGRNRRLICPVIDARRNETFVAAYRWPAAADFPRCALPPAVMPIERFLDRLPAARRGQCLFLGDGALRYRAEIEAHLGERAAFAPPHRMLPSAEEVTWLGQRRLARGNADDPARLEPVYIRPSDARLPASPRQGVVSKGKR